MIRELAALTPARSQTMLRLYLVVAVAAAIARAASCVVLVPLVRALFTEPSDAWVWVGALTALTATAWALELGASRAALAVGSALMHSMFERLTDKLRRIPLGWFTTERTTTAQSMLSSIGQSLYSAMSNLVTPMISASVTPYAIALLLFPASAPVAVAALGCAPLLAASRWAGSKLLRSADADLLAVSRTVDQRVIEFGTHQKVLRAFGRSGAEGSALDEALSSQRRAGLRVLGWAIPGQIVFGFAYQIALLVLAVVTVAQWSAGNLIPAEVIALFVVIVRYLEPFREVSDLAPATDSLRNVIDEANTILDAPELPVADHPVSSGDLRRSLLDAARLHTPAIEFTDVSFSYGPDDAVGVDDVSFSIPGGATTAIVGPSGSGKSTILSLIARFHDVDAGSVSLGGHDVRDLSPDALVDQLGVVPQDVYLFDGSIRSNIAHARPQASDQDLQNAAALARVDEVVDRLDNGWDTRVGEGGASLSGGERQRVSIARALLKGAPLLLLDEVTSAIDSENEAAVLNALHSRERADDAESVNTVVIVAHRERTIANADHIVFVDDGHIVETGRREELLAAGGRFASFWAEREASADWILASRA